MWVFRVYIPHSPDPVPRAAMRALNEQRSDGDHRKYVLVNGDYLERKEWRPGLFVGVVGVERKRHSSARFYFD